MTNKANQFPINTLFNRSSSGGCGGLCRRCTCTRRRSCGSSRNCLDLCSYNNQSLAKALALASISPPVVVEIVHCVSAGLGSHCPGVSLCSVSVQVLVVGPEGMSPSSHWKVAIAPTVVPNTVEFGGNSGVPQSTRKNLIASFNKKKMFYSY